MDLWLKCFVHNNGKDPLGKFDPKSDEAIFLGYSSIFKAYKVLNKRTNKVKESIYVVFDNSSILHGLDDPQVDEFAFPRAQDSGSSSMNADRDSDEEDHPPPLASTSASLEMVEIQGEEEELEDLEKSP